MKTSDYSKKCKGEGIISIFFIFPAFIANWDHILRIAFKYGICLVFVYVFPFIAEEF